MSTTFAPPPSSTSSGGTYATDTELAAAITALKAGATPAADTLGEIEALLSAKAPVASPTFTGDPKAPTPLTADSDTSLATTAFVHAVADAKVTQTIGNGTTATAPSEDAVFDALALKAPLASPALTGNPTAPTPASSDNDTSLATTAFVKTVAAPRDFRWVSGADYIQGSLVVVSGQPWLSRDAHTAGATFAGDLAAHWDLVVPGMEITSMVLTTTFATPASIADVTDAGAGGAVWQVVCPANMGPIRVHCDKVPLATTTGTGTAADTAYAHHIRIFDEANTDLEGNQLRIQSVTTAARTWRVGIPLTVDLPNNASQKTYRVRAFMTNVGTNGCTGNIEATPASGIYSPVLKITRR